MKRNIHHTGYCPKIEAEREIILGVAEFNVVGAPNTQNKVTSFQCPDAINCSFRKEHVDGLCPLADINNLRPT